MPTGNYKPEQIVTILRQIEVQMANGKTTPQACKEAGWRLPLFSLNSFLSLLLHGFGASAFARNAYA